MRLQQQLRAASAHTCIARRAFVSRIDSGLPGAAASCALCPACQTHTHALAARSSRLRQCRPAAAAAAVAAPLAYRGSRSSCAMHHRIARSVCMLGSRAARVAPNEPGRRRARCCCCCVRVLVHAWHVLVLTICARTEPWIDGGHLEAGGGPSQQVVAAAAGSAADVQPLPARVQRACACL